MNYGSYAPLGNSELIGNVVVTIDGVSTVNLARLREYANAGGNDVAKANADGVYDTSDSNFDAAGNLVVPNRLNDGELETIAQSARVAEARRNVDDNNIALAALKELQADNKNALLQPAIDEAVRRAQAEADHYDRQLQNALADDTNQNPVTFDNPGTPVNEAAPFSIATRNADYVNASNDRVTAETILRDAVATREAATQNVIDRFHSPASFYEQLVARREALVDAISDTYEETGINRDSIDALTADTEDGAEADGPITANSQGHRLEHRKDRNQCR